tara:strand:- start:2443 stop:2565 length:123 start_codon:yes stop_codon:yes gene_type:complete
LQTEKSGKLGIFGIKSNTALKNAEELQGIQKNSVANIIGI